jgi:hypothetical protein
VIDSPVRLERLLPRLQEALPIPASLTPRLAALLREQSPGGELPLRCKVTRVDYWGHEGGIMCRLDFQRPDGGEYVVAITHLAFDRRQPLAHDIAACQRHRIKRLMRLAEPARFAARQC